MTLSRDRHLMERVKAGDQRAFRDLFDHHYEELTRLAYSYTRERGEARDVAQTVFIKFWNKRQEIEISKSLKGYLKTMTVYEAIGRMRSGRPVVELTVETWEIEDNGGWADHMVREEELRKKIGDELDKLPEQCGRVFQMSRFEGMTYREIASELDISQKTVENQISKALKRLRSGLKEFIHIFL